MRGKGEGMSEQMKMGFQLLFALIIACVLYFLFDWDYVGIPGLKDPFLVAFFGSASWMIPLATFIIVGVQQRRELYRWAG